MAAARMPSDALHRKARRAHGASIGASISTSGVRPAARCRPKLKVVQTGITRELRGISVRKGNAELRDAIDRAQQALRADGTLQRLVDKWLGAGATVAP